MSAKDLKALGRRFINEFNKGKAAALAVMDEFYATNVVVHSGNGEDVRGLKDYKESTTELFSAFPDVHWRIDDEIVEGNRKATLYTMTGTHKGEFMGIPATNKKVMARMIYISHRNAVGKIVEEWEMYDTLDFMQQLGLAPKPKKEK
jgi:steroid delta-isomerase-like uncharacterized protein